MAPRKQEEENPGEGSYVEAYERTIPADFAAPRRAERPTPAPAASGAVEAEGVPLDTPAARRREQLRQARAAREAAAAEQSGESWASAAFASATSRARAAEPEPPPEPGKPQEAAAGAGSAQAGEPEDFSKLSVKELKARIKACGCTIPSMAMEKTELVTMLQIFSKAAGRTSAVKQEDSDPGQRKEEDTPPATRIRARSRGAFSAMAGADEAPRPSSSAKPYSPDAKASEAVPPSSIPRNTGSAPSAAREDPQPAREEARATSRGRQRRGFAQWSGDGTAEQPQRGPEADAPASAPTSAASNATPGASEEELSSLPLKELKRQLRELNVDIPASICEKSEIVALLARSLRSRPGAAPAPQQAKPPPSHRSPEASNSRESGPSYGFMSDDQVKRDQEEADRKMKRELEEKRVEEQQRRLEQRRQEDLQRQAGIEERRRRLQEAEADEEVAPPPPPPPPPEDISKLTLKELKARCKEAGVPIPPSIVEKHELVAILRKHLARKAASEATQKQAAENLKKKTSDLVPCMNRCGFAVTWHPTHCCHGCPNHGPKCMRKPMPKDWNPYDAMGGSHPRFNGKSGAGSCGPLPQTSGEPDDEERLMRLTLKELKIKCGAAGVTVPRGSEKEDCVALLQEAQRHRRSLRVPGHAEEARAESAGGGVEDDGPEEDFGKISMRELKTMITKTGAKIPAGITEKRELINLYKEVKKRSPKCNSKAKHVGANGSYDRRRTDDARPWLPEDTPGPKKGGEQVPPAGPPSEEDKDGLWQTFGYIAGMEAGSPYARFDIRDEVCLRYGGFKHGALIKDRAKGELAIVVGVKRCKGRPVVWVHPKSKRKPCSFFYQGCNATKMRQLWEQVGEDEVFEAHPMDDEIVEDSDEEMFKLCAKCKLPCGDLAYVNEENGYSLAQHADCITKSMIEATMKQDQERVNEDWMRTWNNRKEFDIGWVPSRMIPINEQIAMRIGGNNPIPSGPMVSLLMEGDPPTLSLTQSIEPTTSVNLNYLITALKVRIYDGREPVFSLDPCPPYNDMRNGFQKKRFEPEWMNGTLAGEVLFQADYHLKELSMGEYDQAINGMKNAMDYSEDTNYWDWRAREWFIVKTAEVWRSQDGVIMPNLVMGVEAREQIVTEDGKLEDAPMTNSDHPLVIYGESFTRYFDLIAERLSVIYHLRELTKAQIIARFIMDSGVRLDESWLKALGKDAMTELKIPQHRREIGRLQLRVYNGEYYQEPDQELGLNIWGVYGGVDLNLDNFDLSEAQQSDKSVLPGEPIDLNSLSEEELRQMIIDHGGTVPPGISEKPDLIEIMLAIMESFQDFWGCISGSGPSPYSREDQSLLRKIFNPFLSDRRLDFDRFIPPTRDSEYIQKLREMLDEEWFVMEERRKIFMSPEFTPGQHSPPFPYAWRSKYGVAIDNSVPRALGEFAGGRLLTKVPSSKASLESVRRMKLIFDGLTEDGTRYRIYNDGKQEVRTIQEHDQGETIVVAFTLGRPTPSKGDGSISGKESVIQVTLCAGVGGEGPISSLEGPEQLELEGSCEVMPHYRFFVLAETKGARGNHRIVTEMLSDGTVTWEEDPPDIEHRRSRAGVLNSFACKSCSVQALREHRKEWLGKYSPFASASACKQYAQGALGRASGVVES